MENQSRVNAIWKLAVVGQQAGFSLEQMIELLNSGMDVVALLDVITWRPTGFFSSVRSPILLRSQ